jgi:hypothetical protein
LRIYLSIYSSILFIRTVWADKLRVESIIYHSETFYSYAFFSSKCSHDYKEKKLWLFLKCNCLQLSTYNVQAKVVWLFRIQQVITIIPLCKCFMRTGDKTTCGLFASYVDQFSKCLYVEYKSKGIDVQCQVWTSCLSKLHHFYQTAKNVSKISIHFLFIFSIESV